MSHSGVFLLTMVMKSLKIYLPNTIMRTEFKKFKKLNTEKEKRTFQKYMQAKISSMSETEKEKYIIDTKLGLNATIEECKRFISKYSSASLKFN